MSEYFKSLPPVAKESYLSKLRCLNLKEEDDPYLSSKFVEDLCLWPSVDYGHIFTYFIQRPGGIYTATVATVEEYGCLQVGCQSCLLTAAIHLALLALSAGNW